MGNKDEIVKIAQVRVRVRYTSTTINVVFNHGQYGSKNLITKEVIKIQPKKAVEEIDEEIEKMRAAKQFCRLAREYADGTIDPDVSDLYNFVYSIEFNGRNFVKVYSANDNNVALHLGFYREMLFYNSGFKTAPAHPDDFYEAAIEGLQIARNRIVKRFRL